MPCPRQIGTGNILIESHVSHLLIHDSSTWHTATTDWKWEFKPNGLKPRQIDWQTHKVFITFTLSGHKKHNSIFVITIRLSLIGMGRGGGGWRHYVSQWVRRYQTWTVWAPNGNFLNTMRNSRIRDTETSSRTLKINHRPLKMATLSTFAISQLNNFKVSFDFLSVECLISHTSELLHPSVCKCQ